MLATLWTLCSKFFLTGLFAVGGGLATLPFLTQMSVDTGWFTQMELANMVAVSESTPGPIGVNMATYVGYTVAGIPGAILATLSLVLPSLIIILIIARVLEKYRKSDLVNTTFSILRPIVTGLISAAAFSLLKIVLGVKGDFGFQWVNLVLVCVIFGLLQIKKVKKIHPILIILFGAVLGVVLKLK